LVESEEAQVAEPVTVRVELSLYVAVARNCRVPPASIVGLSGLTLIEVTVGLLIVSVAVALLPLSAAVIVTDPAATPLASPELGWIVTFVVSEEVQVTEVVILLVEASL